MDPRIVAISGPFKESVFRLADGSVTIGRAESNRISLPEPQVSRYHCIIEMQTGQAEITDLKSHFGTFVNGIRVSRRVLSHGDVIGVGNSVLAFLSDNDNAEMASSFLS